MSGVIYPINNKKYTAEDVEIFNSTRTSGVYTVLDFDCSLSGNVVTVGKGLAWIKNGDFTGKALAFKEPETLTLDGADATNDRYDVVAIRYDASKTEPELVVIKGEAEAGPVIPRRRKETYLYELFLYAILRKAGEGSASVENLIDLRTNETYCGLMRDSVTSAVAPAYETIFDVVEFGAASLYSGATLDFDYEKYQYLIADVGNTIASCGIVLPLQTGSGTNFAFSGSNFCVKQQQIGEPVTMYFRMQVDLTEFSDRGHVITLLEWSSTPDFSSKQNARLDRLVGVTKQPEGYVKVDSVYNPESHNAQSGEAVKQAIEEALENFEGGGGDVEIPENVETTDNKVSIIDENSTDEQYPNAKVVYLGFQDLQSQLIEIKEYIDSLDNSEILDSGKCGENLTWTLRSSGLLRISGTGQAYDYCKGILIGKTREEIEAQVTAGTIPADYAFQEGKTYDDEHGQYVAPWYKYRSEVDFTGYTSEASYNRENPNGWKYNRILIDPGITYIGDWMFYRVSGPTKLVIPEGVTRIGRWGIRFSPTLETVVLPNSLTDIEYRGLSRNEVITSIVFGRKLTTIGDYGLTMNHIIETVELPETVTSIGINQFEGCNSIITARLGHITSIPSRTFVSATNLRDVIIPEEVTSIGVYAFYKCTSLEKINIPSNVATINDNAFYLCENLRTVYIDSQTIADLITSKNSCGYLIKYAECIYIKDGVTCAYVEGNWSYSNTVDGYKKYVPQGSIEPDTPDTPDTPDEPDTPSNIVATGSCGTNVTYTVSKTDIDNEYSLSIDGSGAFGDYKYTNVPWLEHKANIVSVSIGSGISGFPANCFREYPNLKSVVIACETIPNQMFYNCNVIEMVDLTGVKTIGEYAFFSATKTGALTNIVIPDGVTTIGEYAFAGKTASSLTIGKDVVDVGQNGFVNCNGTLYVATQNAIQNIGKDAFGTTKGQEGDLNLPSVVKIGDNAFKLAVNFTNINIGSNITTIGAKAFAANKNATITINKAQADITIGEGAFTMTPSNKLIFVS